MSAHAGSGDHSGHRLRRAAGTGNLNSQPGQRRRSANRVPQHTQRHLPDVARLHPPQSRPTGLGSAHTTRHSPAPARHRPAPPSRTQPDLSSAGKAPCTASLPKTTPAPASHAPPLRALRGGFGDPMLAPLLKRNLGFLWQSRFRFPRGFFTVLIVNVPLTQIVSLWW